MSPRGKYWERYSTGIWGGASGLFNPAQYYIYHTMGTRGFGDTCLTGLIDFDVTLCVPDVTPVLDPAWPNAISIPFGLYYTDQPAPVVHTNDASDRWVYTGKLALVSAYYVSTGPAGFRTGWVANWSTRNTRESTTQRNPETATNAYLHLLVDYQDPSNLISGRSLNTQSWSLYMRGLFFDHGP